MSFWMVLGALRAVCVVLEGPGNRLEFLCILGSPLGPQDSENMELEGKNLILGPRRQTKSRTPTSFGLVFRLQAQDCKLTKVFRLQAQDCKLTNSYLQD